MNQASIMAIFKQLRPMRAITCPKVRVGHKGDGGYVINQSFDRLSCLISLGIGSEVSFDAYFHQRQIPVVQVDGTIVVPPFAPALFVNKNIDTITSETTTTLAEVAELAQRVSTPSSTAKDMILKFDIEGAEWDMFNDTNIDLLKSFRIITGEFHGLTNLMDVNYYFRARVVFDKLCMNHQPTHIHANNYGSISLVAGVLVPDILELSFLRRDVDRFEPTDELFPGPLDFPNSPLVPDFVFKVF